MVHHIDQPNIDLPYEAIDRICRRLGVRQLAVFGSVLRDDFRPDSDIDFLAEFMDHDTGPWLSKLTDLEQALSQLLHHPVQVCNVESVKASRNYLFRNSVLSTARTLYVA